MSELPAVPFDDYEPCECCGVLVTREAVDPNDDYPGNAPWIWREQWRPLAHAWVANWHSPARCRAARAPDSVPPLTIEVDPTFTAEQR